jgi:chemotaxis signal transduction protein
MSDEVEREAIGLLQERARQLAQTSQSDDQESGLPVILFRRNQQLFGVRLEEARGSGRLRDLTAIPGGPDWITGVIQHQGEVLSLIDLPSYWGEPIQGVRDLPTYVVGALPGTNQKVGILVEELLGVHPLEGALSGYHGAKRHGLTEVGHKDAEPVLLLSVRALLEDQRFLPENTSVEPG